MSADKPTVFISYSHKDEKWKDRLVQQLRVLGGARGFDVWDDQRIAAGEAWKAEIERALLSAHVAVLLVSVDFLDSGFIHSVEVPKLLQRREHEKLPVVPVIVRPCPWKRIPWLAEMQVRPKRGKVLSAGKRHEFEAALARIAEEVDALIEQQKARMAAPAARADPPRSPIVAVPILSAEPPSTVPPTVVAAATSVVAPPGVTLRPFSFETVTLDERGQVRERRTLTAHSYLEDLGGEVTLEMVAIPGGTFTMGSPEDEAGHDVNEGPQHDVTVAPFFAGRYPVTQAQWRAVAALPRVARDLDPAPSRFQGATRPVEEVTWHDAVEFCQRIERKTGRSYRLPSEAEWEYAARAGTRTPFAFGPTINAEIVNYEGKFPYGNAPEGVYRQETTDVDLFEAANAFGLSDVHGNVWEWTQDVWHNDYDGAWNDGRAWETGGDPTLRVVRGGSWIDIALECRSSIRGGRLPEARVFAWGLRVVCAVSRTQS